MANLQNVIYLWSSELLSEPSFKLAFNVTFPGEYTPPVIEASHQKNVVVKEQECSYFATSEKDDLYDRHLFNSDQSIIYSSSKNIVIKVFQVEYVQLD